MKSTSNTNFESNIGLKCQKYSGRNREPKPFKSGLKINTIKGVTTNSNTGKPAYTFIEDESCVDCESVIIKN